MTSEEKDAYLVVNKNTGNKRCATTHRSDLLEMT